MAAALKRLRSTEELLRGSSAGACPLFFDFPEDAVCWEVEDSYMFGPDLLVSPVMEAGAVAREIYLPSGTRWTDAYTKKLYDGGQKVAVPAPLGIIPVMMREGKEYDIYR